jgi:DnaJ-class molecular chaperone
MTAIPAHAPPTAPALVTAEQTCPRCGGSGILRMGDQQFRTCLDCLGQGQLPTEVQHELLFPDFRAAVSSVHAR